MEQIVMFAGPPPEPHGLFYRPEILSTGEEAALIARVEELSFSPFEFHGFLGKRRTVSFGWRYGFDGSGLAPSDPIPHFLLPLRERIADLGGVDPRLLAHVLVTEYAPGAGIGWHKDRSVFGDTFGVSLASPCRFRFRRRRDDGWERASLMIEPRSAYVLRGPSRSLWEHSIPPVEQLRYSITLRTLARPGERD